MINLDGFERFSGGRIRGKADEVSINKAGTISFGKAAAARYRLMEFEYAILFFNRKTKEIALKLTNSNGENAFHIRKADDKGQIFAGSFFKFFNVHIKQNVKVVPEYEEVEDILGWKMPEDCQEQDLS